MTRPVRLYMAAGQSNMVGFGAYAEQRHRLAHPSISYQYRLEPGQGLGRPQSVPTFFKHGSIRQGFAAFWDRGAGPWWAFAREIAKHDRDAETRILMLAVNGSSLMDWSRQGGYLDQAIASLSNAAAGHAVVEGVIWHHGESGVGAESGDYHDMLIELVTKLRSATGKPNLPFVGATLPDTSPNAADVNAALNRLVSEIPGCAVVDGRRLSMSDTVHLDTSACEAIGAAMAHAMMRLQEQSLNVGRSDE